MSRECLCSSSKMRRWCRPYTWSRMGGDSSFTTRNHLCNNIGGISTWVIAGLIPNMFWGSSTRGWIMCWKKQILRLLMKTWSWRRDAPSGPNYMDKLNYIAIWVKKIYQTRNLWTIHPIWTRKSKFSITLCLCRFWRGNLCKSQIARTASTWKEAASNSSHANSNSNW